MKKGLLIILMFLLCLPYSAFSQTEHPCADPLERNLIFVEGKASADIPVDGFKIRFQFDVESETFDKADQKSNDVVKAIEMRIKALGLKNVKVIRGWDLLKQSKISFASKERKISNEIIVKVSEYPAGELHSLIARIIDNALAVDESVVLEDISVFLTDANKANKDKELTKTALENLLANAQSAASALGQRLIAPKRIWVTENQPRAQSRQEQLVYGDYGMSSLSKASITINKGFSVSSNIAGYIRIMATVNGIYEIGK